MEIFKLMGSIFVDTAKADESLAKTDKNVHGIAEKLSSGIKTAAKWGAAIVGGATAAGAAIYKVADAAAQQADAIDKGSIRMGISKTQYQELSYAAGQCGVDMGTLEKAAKKLEGTDLNFDDAINQIMALGTEEERSAKASEIFGDSLAYTLSPILAGSGEDFDALRQSAHDLGLVMSDEAVTAGVVMGDTMSDVKQSLQAVVTEVGSQLFPVIQTALDWVMEHMPEIQAIVSAVFEVLGEVVNVFIGVIQWLAEQMDVYWPQIQTIITTVMTAIQTFWETSLKPCFQAIGNFIQTVLAPAFNKVFNGIILPVVQTVFKGIGTAVQTVTGVFQGLITFITGVFSGNWSQAWSGIVKVFGSIFGGITSVVAGPCNAVIGILNRFISGLNRLKIPDWVPGVGGKGINIPSIPYLEKGGVLEKGQTGFLEGTGAEAVVPLEKNQKWISNVAKDMNGALGGQDTVKLLKDILAALQNQSQQIYLDGDKLVGGIAQRMDNRMGVLAGRRARA